MSFLFDLVQAALILGMAVCAALGAWKSRYVLFPNDLPFDDPEGPA